MSSLLSRDRGRNTSSRLIFMGTLYIVGTPIGNIEDISLRAIKILKSVDIIACEDTRHTGNLLYKLDIIHDNPLLSYYEENEQKRIPEIIQLLLEDHTIALVSDAGMPTISDPGFKLIRECLRNGIKVESVPGPSSVITALAISGLPTDKFMFLGYFPEKSGKRLMLLENLKKSQEYIKSTLIFFESPYKLQKSLSDIQTVFGDIEIVLAKELTKVHEAVTREKVSLMLERFKKVKPKGEFVLLFNSHE